MNNVLSVTGALAAAFMFGLSSVLLFRAAAESGAGPRERAAPHRRLRLHLSRLWWAGAGLQVLSFGVQAAALAFGPLALVQPVAATDLLFALPILARWQRRPLHRRDWTGAGLVAVGVAAFLGISPPRAGTATADPHEWVGAVVAVATVVVTASAAARVTRRVARTTLLALAGAADFGLVDALSKNFVGHLRHQGLLTTLGSPDPYALAAAGLLGLVLSQLTFRSGSLHIGLPVIDTVEPTAAVAIGALVFHEALATSAVRLAAQLLAAVVAVAGIVVLDRAWVSADEPVRAALQRNSGRSALPPRRERGQRPA